MTNTLSSTTPLGNTTAIVVIATPSTNDNEGAASSSIVPVVIGVSTSVVVINAVGKSITL